MIKIRNVTLENLHVVNGTFSALSLHGIEQVDIINIRIINNAHKGMSLYDPFAVFHGMNTFRNNKAIYGGGISLYGNSFMWLASNSTLNFINNTADKSGGGIFVSQDELWISPQVSSYEKEIIGESFCFMQLDDLSPVVHFQDNKALYTGSILYGGNIEVCHEYKNVQNLIEFLSLSTNATQCSPPNVSSNAKSLTFCDDDCISTIQTEQTVDCVPGKMPIEVKIAALGQLHGLTEADIKLSYDEQVFQPDSLEKTEAIHAHCSLISRAIHAKRTNTKGNISLTISSNFISASPQSLIVIVVNILQCPIGFSFSPNNGTCVCSEYIGKYADCNITSGNITRSETSWISLTNDSIMVSEHCPFDSCNSVPFPVDNPDGQCDNSRSGMLCGDCIQGYSLSLGSSQCLNCTHQMWQLPVVLIGSAIAGIALVSVLIGLNLTVSVGTINGLLFFVNVVKIIEPVFYSHFKYDSTYKVLHQLLAWMNLDLGMRMCFYDGMDACQKVGLQLVFPLYLLFLVVLIVTVCRCGQWVLFRSIPWVVKISDKTTSLLGSKIVPVYTCYHTSFVLHQTS